MSFEAPQPRDTRSQRCQPIRSRREGQEVFACAQEHVVQRNGDCLGRQSAEAPVGLREIDVLRHTLRTRLAPGDLDTVADPPQQDIGEQPAITRRPNRMSFPPRLPRALPRGRRLIVFLYRVRREPGGPQGLPGGIAFVARGKAFFVQEGIPVAGEPLHQRKKIPMDRLGPFAALVVSTQVAALDPELKAAPGEADIRVGGPTVIGVAGERQLQREFAGVPGKPLPSGAHPCARSVPVRPDVAATDAALIHPPATEAFRHSDPTDGVPVPDIGAMPPRTIRTAFMHSVPHITVRLAIGKKLSCMLCIELPRTEHAAPSPLPRFLVLWAALVTHGAVGRSWLRHPATFAGIVPFSAASPPRDPTEAVRARREHPSRHRCPRAHRRQCRSSNRNARSVPSTTTSRCARRPADQKKTSL